MSRICPSVRTSQTLDSLASVSFNEPVTRGVREISSLSVSNGIGYGMSFVMYRPDFHAGGSRQSDSSKRCRTVVDGIIAHCPTGGEFQVYGFVEYR